MKSEGSRSFLGYVAAFCFGVMVMGVVVLILRMDSTPFSRKKVVEAPSETMDSSATPESSPVPVSRPEKSQRNAGLRLPEARTGTEADALDRSTLDTQPVLAPRSQSPAANSSLQVARTVSHEVVVAKAPD